MPKQARSACEAHRAWIEAQVALGRNAQAIYQDLVEQHGFEARYNSVKRFVRRLRVRDPERFDVLESAPGEEAQVDFGLGAPTLTLNGKYRRPYLFVMTPRIHGRKKRQVLAMFAEERPSLPAAFYCRPETESRGGGLAQAGPRAPARGRRARA